MCMHVFLEAGMLWSSVCVIVSFLNFLNFETWSHRDGENMLTTHRKSPSQMVDLNSWPSCCEATIYVAIPTEMTAQIRVLIFTGIEKGIPLYKKEKNASTYTYCVYFARKLGRCHSNKIHFSCPSLDYCQTSKCHTLCVCIFNVCPIQTYLLAYI